MDGINLEIIGKIAERKIQEAIEEGKFDNLPGRGKPLNLDEDTQTPLHMRMANKVLKNAGILPDWLQVQQDIVAERKEVELQREKLRKEYPKRLALVHNLPANHPQTLVFVEWLAKARAAQLRRLKSVNTSILKFSMMAPTSAAAPIPYRILPEMASFDEEFPAIHDAPEIVLEEKQELGMLKGLARERYQDGEGGGPISGWAKAAGMMARGRKPQSDNSGEVDAEDIRRSDVPGR